MHLLLVPRKRIRDDEGNGVLPQSLHHRIESRLEFGVRLRTWLLPLAERKELVERML